VARLALLFIYAFCREQWSPWRLPLDNLQSAQQCAMSSAVK